MCMHLRTTLVCDKSMMCYYRCRRRLCETLARTRMLTANGLAIICCSRGKRSWVYHGHMLHFIGNEKRYLNRSNSLKDKHAIRGLASSDAYMHSLLKSGWHVRRSTCCKDRDSKHPHRWATDYISLEHPYYAINRGLNLT